MASSEVNEFLCGPLVTWFISCLEDPNVLTNYDDLVDGPLIHNVFLQIDPEPLHDGIVPPGGNPAVRTKNLEMIVGNIKQFYEEELGHLLLRLPDTSKLGKQPESYIGDAKLLLLLLLGCAVQCPNKEKFITNIQTLSNDTQLSIVDCIQQVTDRQEIVVTQESLENENVGTLFILVKKLLQERNFYCEKWQSIAVHDLSEQNDSAEGEIKNQLHNLSAKSDREDNHHYAVELADWKSKVRKQRQELEEKTEALIECKEELEYNRVLLSKVKQENQELTLEARTAKSYRDELDAAIERAERADRLEAEVARYREKLTDIEFYKIRVEELREDNRVLMETREMLEEQLSSSRRRADKVLDLESEVIKYKQIVNDMALERAADQEKYQDLCEENSQLQRVTKAVTSEAALAGSVSDSEEPLTDNRLSEQLTNSAQARALKLELENRRLVTIIESLKENSFHESSSRVLELEKEKKKLSLKVDSLNDTTQRLTQQNNDLELVCKQALEENKKLQNTLKTQRTAFEKQQNEVQTQHTKLAEFEKSYDAAVKEKQRVQSLLKSVQRRADDLDRCLENTNGKLEELRLIEDVANEAKATRLELESKIMMMEKEKESAHRDVLKHRETIEEKDVALDTATNRIEGLERKVQELEQEIDNSVLQISRLQEIERSSKEMDSRAAIDKETLETLQSNLVAEKLNTQQLYTALEKLGVSIDMLLTLSPENILEKIVEIPEVVNLVKKQISPAAVSEIANSVNTNHVDHEEVEALKKEIDNTQVKLTTIQAISESLLSENAKLQVYVTTLESQITSLTSQNTALQLANSQLVAEKEELIKERSVQQRVHSQLAHDQEYLQSLHEQLSNEYENMLKERDALKTNLRDVKNESRILRETAEKFESKCKTLQTECDTLLMNAKSLNNLRGEHSKLKDDFRNLYTASEKLKLEYRNLQEDYRKNKVETNRLSLKLTELQGELSSKDERCSNLELQINKMNQRCEMLLQMNSGLDNDRRSLMDHISVLFSQYHELLTHSLEDKEHYHMEEKMYTDKVNHLYRQKEKLEEKIMEHYRKLESCSTKKKSLGASLVRRVRKAVQGSELFNKNRRSWAEETKQEGKPCESESGGSDISNDETRVSVTNSTIVNDSLSLGTPGTRRTMYFTGDSTPPPVNLVCGKGTDESFNKPEGSTQGETSSKPEQSEARPFLIYNKVSAVINESTSISSPKDAKEVPVEPHNEKDPKTGNSVWYEYGCV